MFIQTETPARNSSHEIKQKDAPSQCPVIVSALVIIVGIGGLVAAGVGVAAFCQVGSLSQLSQVHAIILMAAGGGGGLLLIVIGSVVCHKNRTPKSQKEELNSQSTHRQSTSDNKNNTSSLDNTEKSNSQDNQLNNQSKDKNQQVPQKTEDQQPEPPKDVFSSEKFCSDKEYRSAQLSKNSWFCDDSTRNRKLILAIDSDSEYLNIRFDALPAPVLKDFYSALKDHPKKAKAFYQWNQSPKMLDILEERDIALYYGDDIRSFYTNAGLYRHLESQAQKDKVLKAVLKHFDAIPDIKKDDDVGFICKMIYATRQLNSLEERQKEYKKIFELLCEINFNWENFLNKFVNWTDVREKNDHILTTEFPLIYVRESRKRADSMRLLIALFEANHGFDVAIFNNLCPSLTKQERDHLEAFFSARNHKGYYTLQLKRLKQAASEKASKQAEAEKPASPKEGENTKDLKETPPPKEKPAEPPKQEEPPKEACSFDRFCKESAYRREQLRNNSWFSKEGARNFMMIGNIAPEEYADISIDKLSKDVLMDFYLALKDHQAKKFYEIHFSPLILDILSEKEIALYYGEEVCSKYPNGRFAHIKSQTLEDKVIKAMITNFDVIPNQELDADVTFIRKILKEARKLSTPAAKQKEYKRIFNLLCETKLNWSILWNRINYFPGFPLVYVQEALKRDDFKNLLIAFFEVKHEAQASIFKEGIVASLTEAEKDNLEAFFISRDGVAQEYFPYLNLLKPEKYPEKKENKKEQKTAHPDHFLLPAKEEIFATTRAYRKEQLLKNSWFSKDSASNCKMILAIDPKEYIDIQIDQLPEHVLKDFHSALKDQPKKAKEFYGLSFSPKMLNLLDDKEIARYYGNEVINHYLEAKCKFLQEDLALKDKVLKAVFTHFNLIPDVKLDDDVRFVYQVLKAAKASEYKQIMDYPIQWHNFWDKYTNFAGI